MNLESRQLVLKKLAVAFPDPVAARNALVSLDRFGMQPHERDVRVHGVHLAIIELSDGQLWRLRELVKAAKHDYRDVVFPATMPEQFQDLRENPPPMWGELPRRKALTAAKRAAMEKRDYKQWMKWIRS